MEDHAGWVKIPIICRPTLCSDCRRSPSWGLEQTRYFTQGCDNLLIVPDHKPLLKILGDRKLDEITNSRLFRLKQRTLHWRFEIKHMPGKCNLSAGATSRNPSPSGHTDRGLVGSPSNPDLAELALMAAIRSDTTELVTFSWSIIAEETVRDASLGQLPNLIEQGNPSRARSHPAFESF